MASDHLDSTLTASETQQQRCRATRSDKGQPRVYVEMPGVRYDLLEPLGRRALGDHLQSLMHESQFGDALLIFQTLLAHIERLSKK